MCVCVACRVWNLTSSACLPSTRQSCKLKEKRHKIAQGVVLTRPSVAAGLSIHWNSCLAHTHLADESKPHHNNIIILSSLIHPSIHAVSQGNILMEPLLLQVCDMFVGGAGVWVGHLGLQSSDLHHHAEWGRFHLTVRFVALRSNDTLAVALLKVWQSCRSVSVALCQSP